MHRCLLIHEVLEKIATEVSRSGHGKAYVLAFALTCRAFLEPGLDTLWRDLYCISPLAFAFHPYVTPILAMSTVFPPTVSRLSRVPEDEDWGRFAFYARRIRSLTYHTTSSYQGVTLRFLIDLCTSRPSQPLLPNLRTLHWAAKQREYFPFISLFISPVVNDITVVLSSEANAVVFWDHLRLAKPALQSLYVILQDCDRMPSRAAQMAFSETIHTFDNITSLRLADSTKLLPITTSDIVTLSQFRKLETLQFTFDHPCTTIAETLRLPNESFLSLVVLMTHSQTKKTFRLTSQLVKGICSTGLEVLTINSSSLLSSSEMTEFLEVVAKHKRLCAINIILEQNQAFSALVADPNFHVSTQTIAPAFKLASLRLFTLCGFPIRFNRETLQEMAQAWPHIDRLSCSEPIIPSLPALKLRDLVVVAESFHTLRHLSLDFEDEGGIPFIESTKLVKRRRSNLPLLLDLKNCKISDPKSAAVFLTSLFPNVKLKSPITGSSLRRLADELTLMQAVREQERDYIAAR